MVNARQLFSTGALALASLAMISAQPQGAAAQPPAAASVGQGLQLAGYQVLAEPDVVERPNGALVTRSLRWMVRSVYRDGRGASVHARVVDDGKKRAPIADSTVAVNRPWEPDDVPRASHLFVDRQRALRRFAGVSKSPDITLLPATAALPVASSPSVAPAAAAAPAPDPTGRPAAGPDGKRPLAWLRAVPSEPATSSFGPVASAQPPTPTPAKGSCEEALIKQGHHASQLAQCRGVDVRCARALIGAGHHPSQLQACRAVEPVCAETVLKKGHHPSQLVGCKATNLDSACVQELIGRGHHPSQVKACGGVDRACAVALLQRGNHPSHLKACRR